MIWLYVTVFAVVAVYSLDRLIRSFIEGSKHETTLAIICFIYSTILICKLV